MNLLNVYFYRTVNDWTSSNEKAVTSLFRTLEDLKSQLSTSGTPQVRTQLLGERQLPRSASSGHLGPGFFFIYSFLFVPPSLPPCFFEVGSRDE